jgi:DNA-binding transcriptional LysR family regulator
MQAVFLPKEASLETIYIQYFLDIASGSTYEEVADKYHISQSSISKSIAHLENDLGVDLFVKKQHRASLTPAGKEFYTKIKDLQPRFSEILHDISRYGSSKRISVCAAPTWDSFNMRYRFLNSDFHDQFPDINVELVEYKDIYNCTPEISDDTLDFGIMHLFEPVKSNCDYRILCQDILWALFPKNHPLSVLPSVTPAELKDYTIFASTETMKHTIREINSSLDFLLPTSDPSEKYIMRREQLIYRTAYDSSQHCTMLYESDIEGLALKNVCSVPITGVLSFPLVIAWKKGRILSEYCQTFLDYFVHMMSVPEHF